MKLAFIFPGQGSQKPGMGQAFYEADDAARALIDAAAAALKDRDLKALMFEGPADELTLTANAQPAILTASAAALEAFRARLPEVTPAFVAGHSLGEFTALWSTGVFDVADMVQIVADRGRLMQSAVAEGAGKMAAVIGLEGAEVARICEEISTEEAVVTPANFNAPTQTVIAGHAAGVDAASEALKAAGARRVLPLQVSAPFHCPLMAPVEKPFAGVLSGHEPNGTRVAVPIVANVTAEAVEDLETVRRMLLQQITAPVQWVRSIEFMVGEGVDTFIEFGEGKVLSGLLRKIDPDVTCYNVSDPASLDATVAALEAAA